MATPFLGQIQMFSFNFPPVGWAVCNGQLLSIAQNTALFSLLGTTYGGNGQTTFALPNLQGRTPIHFGQSPGLSPRSLGETGGQETVTLISTQMPAHNHSVSASTAAPTAGTPAGNVWAQGNYSSTANAPMSPADIGVTGQGQPHENRSPYLVVNFCIALQGIYPSRN